MASLPNGHLRDRLFTTPSDPVKSAIMKESAMGWARAQEQLSDPNSLISPLRIEKRESNAKAQQIALARRSSSSYKHIRNSNLVSNSPFKSQPSSSSIPSTSPVAFPTRRVSGEKRPRPTSLHEQGENDNARPFALKRERRQSKSFQNLIAQEPVTKSPFRQITGSAEPEDVPLPLPPPPTMTLMTSLPVPAQDTRSSNSRPSPTRSNLVSKRLHGPRLSGGRRPRRKTVTFDERCDVVEFDREDESDEIFESAAEEGYEDEDGEGDPFFQRQRDLADEEGEEHPEDSFEVTVTQEGQAEIPSIVDESEDISISDALALATEGRSTPPRQDSFPSDLEVVDGIPLGRTHHSQRLAQYHQLSRSSRTAFPAQPFERERQANYPFGLNRPSRESPPDAAGPATPSSRSPGASYSTPPLGRSTHLERNQAARDEDEDVSMLPASPSPRKQPATTSAPEDHEGLIPKFDPDIPSIMHKPGPNPFTEPLVPDVSYPFEQRRHSGPIQDLLIETENLSESNTESNTERIYAPVGAVPEDDHSELGHSSPVLHGEHDNAVQMADDLIQKERDEVASPQSLSMLPPLPQSDASERAHLAASLSPYSGSPFVQTPSPSHALGGLHSSGSVSGRPRIDRDDVKRRLIARHQSPSFSPHLSPQLDFEKDLSAPSFDQDSYSLDEELPSEIRETLEDHGDSSMLTSTADNTMEEITMEETTIEEENTTDMIEQPSTLSGSEFGFLAPSPHLQFDFGNSFSLGTLRFGNTGGSTGSKDSFVTAIAGSNRNSASIPRSERVDSAGGSTGDSRPNSMKLGSVDVSVDMRSALDRLMDDVADARVDEDTIESEADDSFDSTMEVESEPEPEPEPEPELELQTHHRSRSSPEPALLGQNLAPMMETDLTGSSTASLVPPMPLRGAIRSREALVLEKRREARRLEAHDDDGDYTSPKVTDDGRPSRRKSMDIGDVLDDGSRRRRQQLLSELASGKGMNDVMVEDDPLGDSIERELRKLDGNKTKYFVKEREAMIYASASSNGVISHMAGPGNVTTGKAWRPVRRPSDMNEYAKEIKEYRAQAKPGKAYGKVFVKVLGVKGLHLPIPQQPTAMTCTVNNGIHFVTTPECELGHDCKIDQEFELIEHSKLEFTLTLKIRRDPHILAQFKALIPSPLPPLLAPPPKTGMRIFFSSPKRPKDKAPNPPPKTLPENFARYLKPDSTLARAFISFKDIALRCDSRLFETSFPLIGQRSELDNKYSTLQVGEIVLQIFRLPPLPGIPTEQLPQSLEECHRGLRHINWHKVTYYEGTLTQNGGDCNTWRRRQYRVIGGNLVAFNHVTKRPITAIDLKQAVAVEDDDEVRYDLDGLVERSFRLIFQDEEEIAFFADTDEEKATWLEVFRALIGYIPPYPLWGEILWQYQEEKTKRANANAASSSAVPSRIEPPQLQSQLQRPGHRPQPRGR